MSQAMKRISDSISKIWSAAIILLLSLLSCEKEEDYGNRIHSAGNDIHFLYWSGSSEEIIYGNHDYYDYYKRSLYAVDINSRVSHKIADIKTSPDNKVFQKESKIFYFNNLDYLNTKLYSVNLSGSTPELIIDSLETPVFSKKYIAFMRRFYTPDTSYTKTILYDLDNKTEKQIESVRNDMPVAISPDGSRLLLRSWDYFYNNFFYSICNTESGTITDLSVSAQLYLYDFFWVDNEVYACKGLITGFDIINVVTGQKINFSEPLTFGNYYISPSGNMVAYLVEERPALAAGFVGNHYFLHILKAGATGKTIIDLERDNEGIGYFTFSPDETRIAYVRKSTDIYILNL